MLDDYLGFSGVTVEVATKTVHLVRINKLIEWRDSHLPSPRELIRKMKLCRATGERARLRYRYRSPDFELRTIGV